MAVDVGASGAVNTHNLFVVSLVDLKGLLVDHLQSLVRQLLNIINKASVVHEVGQDVFKSLRSVMPNFGQVLEEDLHRPVVFLLESNMQRRDALLYLFFLVFKFFGLRASSIMSL